ncbi:hypothetical protein PLICRDRAFT_700945 [Plicaturopsis crispa FD-325 SS-3]|nr:hypothetical protein PLICRDRAFT_700945 [Plicaturopsis crispa FD-325 SS-3]
MPLTEASSLRIERPGGAPYILRNIKRSRHVLRTPQATATVNSIIQDNPHCTVYRASINGHDVVLKVSVPKRSGDSRSFDDLEKEGKVYSRELRDLQGTAIPRSYGFYRGSDAGRRKVCCLVMEDCGDTVAFFDRLDPADKVKVMQNLAAVHGKGYRLCDFAERNVVSRDGDYRLIDLHEIEVHDKCKWDGDLRVNDPEALEDICCDHILVTGLDMNFWPSFNPNREVSIGGKVFQKSRYPPQEAIDALLQGVDSRYLECNLPTVTKWLLQYKLDLDNGTAVSLQDYKRDMPELPRKPPNRVFARRNNE